MSFRFAGNEIYWKNILVGVLGWNEYAQEWDITNADPDIPGFAPCRVFLSDPDVENVLQSWLKARDVI